MGRNGHVTDAPCPCEKKCPIPPPACALARALKSRSHPRLTLQHNFPPQTHLLCAPLTTQTQVSPSVPRTSRSRASRAHTLCPAHPSRTFPSSHALPRVAPHTPRSPAGWVSRLCAPASAHSLRARACAREPTSNARALACAHPLSARPH